MFELRKAEKQFMDRYPEMVPLFRGGYLTAAFSDKNTIEIIPTQAAHELALSYYRRDKLI